MKKSNEDKFRDWYKLAVSLALPFAAAAIGSAFTVSGEGSWYSSLAKPFFNPPGWIFGPVWTFLYILMGVSLYLVWKKNAENSRNAYIIFGIQLFLNAMWSILFFGMHQIFGAFICIILLLASIITASVLFYKISRPAGLLFIPYILWVSFASVLNFAIFILN